VVRRRTTNDAIEISRRETQDELDVITQRMSAPAVLPGGTMWVERGNGEGAGSFVFRFLFDGPRPDRPREARGRDEPGGPAELGGQIKE